MHIKPAKKILQAIQTLFHIVSDEVQDSDYLALPLGWLGFIGFPAYYYIWYYLLPQPYENLHLRLIGSILCFGLVIRDYWPKFIESFFHIYWFLTSLFTLPFFFCFMLLKNHFSTVQSMSYLAALFLLLMMFEWVTQLILFLLGTGLAIIAYHLTESYSYLNTTHYSYLFIYLFVLVVGSIFTRRKKEFQRRKLEGMVTISTTVAHELRTPLLGIKSGISALERYLPILFEGYEAAINHQLPVKKIRRAHYINLPSILERVRAESNYSNTIIDMLLMNVRQPQINQTTFENVSMQACIEEALERYPFNSLEDRNKIHIQIDENFYFKGSKILMIHVIFNLLKNALHFIHKNKRGSVFVQVKTSNKENLILFKDTGTGIAKSEIPKLFKLFYSTTLTGTGIGLAFSKKVMETFEGKISVQSVYNEYTLFTLHFPKLTTAMYD